MHRIAPARTLFGVATLRPQPGDVAGACALDPGRWGAKAAHLSRLARGGFPVPDGFAIAREHFDGHLARTGLADWLSQLWRRRERIDPDFLAAALGEARTAVAAGPLPAALGEVIRERTRSFGPLPAGLAVRSSATDEDGCLSSAAGQHRSFLEIDPADAEAAVRDCWASFFEPASWAYRSAFTSLGPMPAMGVLVMPFVPFIQSGVLFTRDPRAGCGDELLVEIVDGACEALVSGRVTPRSHRLARRGPLAVPVTEAMAPWLDALRTLALQVEESFGAPQDIEWGRSAHGLCLVQSRPVTPARRRRPVSPTLLSNLNIGESWPDPLSPLNRSLLLDHILVEFGVRQDLVSLCEGAVRAHCVLDVHEGRLYWNVNELLGWAGFAARIVAGPGLEPLDPGAARSIAAALDRGEFSPSSPRPRARQFAEMVRFLWRQFKHRGPADVGLDAEQVLEREFIKAREKLRSFHLEEAPGSPGWFDRWALGASVANAGLMTTFFGLFPRFSTAMVTLQVIENLFLDGDPRAAALWTTQHLVDPTARMDAALDGLAREAALQPQVRHELALQDHEALARRRADPADSFGASYGRFLADYGHRVPGEMDLAVPRWVDDPSQLDRLLGRLVPAVDRHLPRSLVSLEPEAVPAFRAARERLRGHRIARWFGVDRILTRAFAAARRWFPAREGGKHFVLQLFLEARQRALEAGRALVLRGVLRQSRDVFDLTVDELELVASHPSPARSWREGAPTLAETLADLLRARRRTREVQKARKAPSLVWWPAPPPSVLSAAPASAAPEPDGARRRLRGQGASSGRIRARARKVIDPATTALEPGEILVAARTDPAWTPLFMVAGALVIEHGGLLSHASVVARELGVPAVIGVEDLMEQISDGALLDVDGDSGVVDVWPQ